MKDKLYLQLTGRENNDIIQYGDNLIHKDIISPFEKLRAKAKKEINAQIDIISSFRDYNRQEIIWNNKASGKRKVLDDNECIVMLDEHTPEDFIEFIMRFSAIPGLSRHHWGTDIDIFDSNKLEKSQVQLVHSECVGDGPFTLLHQWLDDAIQSDQSFQFFRPYEKDLGGISVEKWHISYSPIAENFFQQYSLEFFARNIEESQIIFKDIILKNIEYYFEKYFKRINLA